MNTKELILQNLLNPENEDGFISGQELAKRSGFSRAAIWKAVNSLRNDGYNILASTNHGYKLESVNIFNENSIAKHINPDSNGKIIYFEEIDSTNNEAKRQIINSQPQALHKTAFIANGQTAGKGRLNRKFYSPKNTGVYISLIYALKNITDPAFITATAAVAVRRAIKNTFGIESGIKWVNDIFINGKKVCGILTEGITNFETGTIEACIIGIGINLQPNFNIPEEIKDIVSSVLQKNCTNEEKSKFTAEVINELIFLLDNQEKMHKTIMDEYSNYSILIGKQIEFCPITGIENNYIKATVVKIDKNAELILQLENGEIRGFKSGEITIHSKNLIH